MYQHQVLSPWHVAPWPSRTAAAMARAVGIATCVLPEKPKPGAPHGSVSILSMMIISMLSFGDFTRKWQIYPVDLGVFSDKRKLFGCRSVNWFREKNDQIRSLINAFRAKHDMQGNSSRQIQGSCSKFLGLFEPLNGA